MPDIGGENRIVFVVLDDLQLWIILALRSERIYLEWTKPLAERDVLFLRHILIAKEQDLVFQQCIVDGVEYGTGQRLGQIEAANFSANRGLTAN